MLACTSYRVSASATHPERAFHQRMRQENTSFSDKKPDEACDSETNSFRSSLTE